MLPFDRVVTYEEVARAAAATGTEPPSALKSIFHAVSGNDGLLAAWLSSDARDTELVAKNAAGELVKLVRSRLGLELTDGTPLTKLRAITVRYVLAGEFRSDLTSAPPSILQGVPAPGKKDEAALRAVARTMRWTSPRRIRRWQTESRQNWDSARPQYRRTVSGPSTRFGSKKRRSSGIVMGW